jgi:hypothetical protein
MFVPSFLVCVGISGGLCVAFVQDLGLARGNSYAGWIDQFLIGASYVAFLLKRPGLEGQSLYIVLTRLLGTLLIIPAQELEAPGLRVLQVLYGGFILFDLTYLVLYVRRCRALGVNPWRRL